MERVEINGEMYVRESDIPETTGAAIGVNRPHPFKVGEKYFIQTVTYHSIIEVSRIVGDFIIGTGIVWVADSGRFQQAIENGELDEVEPIRESEKQEAIEGGINVNTITHFYEWKHDLPTKQQ